MMVGAKTEKYSFDKLKTSGRGLQIDERALESLFAEAVAALPHEACGLLLGRAGEIASIRPARNVHPAPVTHFEIDPQALIDAHRAEREGGLAVLGYYHSHPTGDPHPSPTDRAMSARDGRIWAIIAPPDRIKFWEDGPTGFQPLPHSLQGR
ncbi:MAG: M67 family metallopeptidase [Pseudomonadota bacterium]